MKTTLLRPLAILSASLMLACAARAEDLATAFKEVQAAPKAASFGEHATRLLALLKGAPNDVAADALIWIVVNDSNGTDFSEQALAALAKDHGANPKVGATFRALGELAPTVNVEKFLRAIVASSPDPELKSTATYHLARTLKGQFDVLTMRLQNAKTAVDQEAVEILNGKELVQKLKTTKPEVLSAEAQKLYEQFIAGGSEGRSGRRSLSGAAKSELFELKNLSVGCAAPETEGEDVDGKKFKLSDHRGKIVVLFFWGDW